MSTSAVREILDALEPATSQAYWEAVRSAWIRFHDHKHHAEEFARQARKTDNPETRKAFIGYRQQDEELAEHIRVTAIELVAPFWRAYGQLREVAPLLLVELPILPDDDRTTYEPRTLALAVRSVVSGLMAMDSGSSPARDEKKTDDPFADLREFARDELVKLQKAIVLTLISHDGPVPIEDLPMLLDHEWDDAEEGYKGLAKHVNPKIKSLGWKIARLDSAARLVKIKGQKRG